MDGSESNRLEVGFVGACLGFVAGPASFILGFLILPISYALGATPRDGSLGYAVVALPLSLAIGLALAYLLARRTQGSRAAALGGTLLGFSGFWALLLGAGLAD